MQLPGAAEPVHSHSKPDGVFNFPRAISACYTNAISTSAAASQHQLHSTISSLSERTCPSSIPISSLYESSDQVNHYDFGEDSYFNDDTFENRCYFNDGSAEDCYFYNDNKEVATLPSPRRL